MSHCVGQSCPSVSCLKDVTAKLVLSIPPVPRNVSNVLITFTLSVVPVLVSFNEYFVDHFLTIEFHVTEICPKRNGSDTKLSSKSHVENLPEPVPHLFETLTEENDTLSRWTVYTRPVQVSFVTESGTAPKEITFGPGTKVTFKEDGLDQEEDVQINCTVAYMSDCIPFNKCKSSCTSMGASAYRWFHDGCCECVGPNCINYGIEESKCLLCPLKTDKDEEEMVIDGPASKPVPNSKSDVSEDYEVAPAPTNEEEEKQENNVKKDDTTEDGQKKSEKIEKLETSTMI